MEDHTHQDVPPLAELTLQGDGTHQCGAGHAMLLLPAERAHTRHNAAIRGHTQSEEDAGETLQALKT